jgi:hypothetical protein
MQGSKDDFQGLYPFVPLIEIRTSWEKPCATPSHVPNSIGRFYNAILAFRHEASPKSFLATA